MANSTNVYLDVASRGTKPLLPAAKLRSLARKTMLVSRTKCVLELSVAFVDRKAMTAANTRYRKKHTPTDVLSFSLGSVVTTKNKREQRLLGQILLCPAMIRQRTRMHGITLRQETAMLFVHAVLHILGFDHIREYEYRAMRSIERKVLGPRYFS